MKFRLAIQNSSQSSDGQGGYTESWTTADTVWASITPLKGFERFQAGQMQTPLTHKIIIRYRSDVTTATRFLYGSRVLWAKEVINIDENSRFLSIKALERA